MVNTTKNAITDPTRVSSASCASMSSCAVRTKSPIMVMPSPIVSSPDASSSAAANARVMNCFVRWACFSCLAPRVPSRPITASTSSAPRSSSSSDNVPFPDVSQPRRVASQTLGEFFTVRVDFNLSFRCTKETTFMTTFANDARAVPKATIPGTIKIVMASFDASCPGAKLPYPTVVNAVKAKNNEPSHVQFRSGADVSTTDAYVSYTSASCSTWSPCGGLFTGAWKVRSVIRFRKMLQFGQDAELTKHKGSKLALTSAWPRLRQRRTAAAGGCRSAHRRTHPLYDPSVFFEAAVPFALVSHLVCRSVASIHCSVGCSESAPNRANRGKSHTRHPQKSGRPPWLPESGTHRTPPHTK
mmetsp:Transcript_9291/g.34694  ORF Transcript_9291/g.34694 Transcript_9291/m.34694 type:complete len:357 (+) Transcript_9291:379-1449(+)